MLDEIDKMSMDFRGDPSSALLEVLDPEQNATFNDHYLEVDFDLSEVMFVATANSLNIPAPLLDRMEVIRMPGYTEDEKLNIARRYLVPKQMKANGLEGRRAQDRRVGDPRHHALLHARVRRAQPRARDREDLPQGRQGAAAASRARATGARRPRRTSTSTSACAGSATAAPRRTKVGLVTGLAWTEVGGELLHDRSRDRAGQGQADPHRPARRRDAGVDSGGDDGRAQPRRGARPRRGLPRRRHDVHIHVPEGATPKDGPSRGHRDVRGARLGADENSGALECRDDGRDHAARRGACRSAG